MFFPVFNFVLNVNLFMSQMFTYKCQKCKTKLLFVHKFYRFFLIFKIDLFSKMCLLVMHLASFITVEDTRTHGKHKHNIAKLRQHSYVFH